MPVTRPLALTVATVVLLLVQVTTRPVSVLPAESFVTAASCRVAPTAMVAEAGLTVTVATGTTMTVIADVAVLPALVAVIVAAPAARPVTRPLALTVAAVVLLLVHVTTRPVSVVPAESRVTAESCCVPPTATFADAGLTLTVATGTVLPVMLALACFPSLVAVMVAEPAPAAVARALPGTGPIRAVPLVPVPNRPGRPPPVQARGAAVGC